MSESENEPALEVRGDIDPVAMALALGGASREDANAFLKKQGALIDDQRHHLREQFKHLHLSVWEKRLGVFLRLATAAVGVAIASAIALTAWNASQADGTVVDAFSVPPQFAQAGITGEMVADDLTSRIGAVRNFAQNNSVSASQNVRKDSADDIKVEIPETGVSLGQAWRYLRLWLGHERHLSGSVRLIGEGKMALTVAVNGERAASVSGSDLDKLEQQAAEQVFASVDPTNIVLYLRARQRFAESLSAAEHGVQVVPPQERAEALALWANVTRVIAGDMPLAFARARRAVAINPKFIAGHRETMWASVLMGHDEDALSQAQMIAKLQAQDQLKVMQGRGFAQFAAEAASERDAALGAFADGMSRDSCLFCLPYSGNRAEFAARAHDGSASRTLASEIAAEQIAGAAHAGLDANAARARYFSEVNMQDWPAAAASARAYAQAINTDATLNPGMTTARLRILADPLLAYAVARGGDIAGAQAVIDATPGDCYDCVRTRALIAAAAKQWDRADTWFAQAIHVAPSIPFAYADWGQSLLARGQADAAIEKFKLASQKGPRFADPLEGWGEALMASNQSHLALAKFAEAEKYAPNWGRLHLKWGEALLYSGKRDQARAQLLRAAAQGLTSSEKSELAGLGHV
jgi:tetratricopeptide (TPR) repeat protein